MGLINNYTNEELIHKMFEYELLYQIPYYEEERSGGFQQNNSGDCTDCIDYISSQWDTPDNGDGTFGGPKVLITAPHATSQYRAGEWYGHDCGISAEECDSNVEGDFDGGHNQGCCGKEPDNYTGALARIVAEMTGMPAIITSRKDMDANKYHTSNYGGSSSDRLYFKQKIQDIIWDYPSIELVIDLHGADYWRPFEIDVGTGGGKSLIDWANGDGWIPWWPPGNPNSADQNNPHDIDTSNYIDILREAAGLYGIPNYEGEGGITVDHTFSGGGQWTDSVIRFVAGDDSDCGQSDPECPDWWWFERPGLQLEINERYRTGVEYYPNPDPDWRFNPELFGTGPDDINSDLVKMIRMLSAFVWNIQTGEFPLDDPPDILDCSCNCTGDNCSVCDIVQYNYENGTFSEEEAAKNCYMGSGMNNCEWDCGEHPCEPWPGCMMKFKGEVHGPLYQPDIPSPVSICSCPGPNDPSRGCSPVYCYDKDVTSCNELMGYSYVDEAGFCNFSNEGYGGGQVFSGICIPWWVFEYEDDRPQCTERSTGDSSSKRIGEKKQRGGPSSNLPKPWDI